MPVQCRVLGSPLLGRARDTPFLGFGAFRERRALLPGLMAKGTAARADDLVTEFERAAAVEDIMTEARSPRIGLMARYECQCATPRAGSAGTRAQSVFVGEGLFTVLAALVRVCLHLV